MIVSHHHHKLFSAETVLEDEESMLAGKEDMKKNCIQIRRLGRLACGLIVMVLVGASIWEQLHLPPEQRTWQGRIIGIPYDFRWPTLERIREKVWNKSTSRILTPHLFGVGWSINFYPLLHPKSGDDPTEQRSL